MNEYIYIYLAVMAISFTAFYADPWGKENYDVFTRVVGSSLTCALWPVYIVYMIFKLLRKAQ
jgi:hypothetical protein